MQKAINDPQKWEKTLAKIVAALKEFRPQRVLLFGSRARGDHRKNSDIDIAIISAYEHRQKRKIRERVDEVSGLYSVDLLFWDELAKDFRKRIEKEGIVLYEKK